MNFPDKKNRYSSKLAALALLLAITGGVSAQDATATTADSLPAGKTDKQVPVAYGFQSFGRLTGAVSTVSGEVLRKTNAPNVSNTLFGRLPGLTVMQGSGEPGYDAPGLLLRGKASYRNNGMLTFVDGFESSFDQMSIDEIESITILKDAAALAMYGIRGANGVILVTTKRGTESSKTKITFNARTGWQQVQRLPEFVDAYNYASLYNEALANDGQPARYTQADLDAYRSGNDPYFHPDVNWFDEVLRKSAPLSDYSLTFNGGNSVAQYNIVLGYMRNQGIYANTDKDRKENSNADFRRYNFRSNFDIKLSNAVSASFDLAGRIEDRSFPNFNGTQLWTNMARYPANAYPVKNPNGTWGGNAVYIDNPVASVLARGTNSTHDRNLMGTFRLNEKLDFLLPGLSFSQLVSFNNWSRGAVNRTRNIAVFELSKNGNDTVYRQHGQNTDPAVDEGGNDQWNRTNVQLQLNYDRKMGNNGLAAQLVYHQDVYRPGGNNVPFANQNIAGRVNYHIRNTYIVELGMSYSGSESFPAGNRFGFFPSLSAAWIASNESFLSGSKTITFLKARASAGLLGNDRTNGSRFAYDQYYFFDGSGYSFGKNNNWWGAVVEGALGNPGITWEKAMKYNIGVDATFFNRLDVNLELFHENRKDILATADATVPGYVGVAMPLENLGQVKNKGFELSATYTGKTGDLTWIAGSSVWYARNKIIRMNEVVRPEAYLYRTGLPVGQSFGLEAIGFFRDEADIAASPLQTFSPVRPGDIKYKDQNGDGLINENDEISFGKAFEPEITYTANLGLQYKGFDLELFFHGIANRTVYLNGPYFWALQNDNNIATNALGRWTPQTADVATYPRLTTLPNDNNYRASTFWSRSGNALRLRNAEIGYSFPSGVLEQLKLTQFRVFASAINPFIWDKVDSVDPESLGGYPPMKSYNIGARIQF